MPPSRGLPRLIIIKTGQFGGGGLQVSVVFSKCSNQSKLNFN